ncbi:MAG TPA: hypothetical protein VGA38_12715 [Candidatus Limnocylindria bacterium]
MTSIGDSATILFAAVGICCGVPLLFGAVAAATAGLGLATAGALLAGAGLVAVSLALLAIRYSRRRRADVR